MLAVEVCLVTDEAKSPLLAAFYDSKVPARVEGGVHTCILCPAPWGGQVHYGRSIVQRKHRRKKFVCVVAPTFRNTTKQFIRGIFGTFWSIGDLLGVRSLDISL